MLPRAKACPEARGVGNPKVRGKPYLILLLILGSEIAITTPVKQYKATDKAKLAKAIYGLRMR